MGDECNVSEKEVGQAVLKHLNASDITVKCFEIKPASDDPLGFLGDHVRIKVTALVNGEEKPLQYFAKKIPTKVKSHKEYAEGTKAFYKEIELYKTLFEDMRNAISVERRHLKWRPDCYYTRDWDLLIVEDLSLQGFYMLPERTLMGLEYMNAAVQAMARMHANSITFEEKLNAGLCGTLSPNFTNDDKKHTIRGLYPNLVFESECTDTPGHPGYKFWEVGISSQVAIVDYLPGYSTEQREKIKQVFPDVVRQVYRMLEPSNRFRNVMIHADLWGNNILFRDKDGQVAEAITVDFQMTRYAPPAQDLFMLLHIMQDRAFRQAHEADLVNLYYASLSQELVAEHLDINSLLPRQEFEESCQFYKRYAVLNQMIYTQLNITPPHLVGKFMTSPEQYDRIMLVDRTDILVESFQSDELCRARTTEAMQEIIELFHLA